MKDPLTRRIALATRDEVLAQRFVALAQLEKCHLDILTRAEDLSVALERRAHLFVVADVASGFVGEWGAGCTRSLACPTPLVLMDLRTHAGALALQATWYPRREALRLLGHAASLIPAAAPAEVEQRIVGTAPEIRLLHQQIQTVARFRDVSVLTLGETGTGKELVAECIHALSCSASSPFVAINCAAIPEQLFESELFGHEAGAYTGARGARPGLLETARQGTLFLDEIAEMPPFLQSKLLRALESRRFRRVGSNHDLPLSARIVSATNQAVLGGERGLRPDLYYRLAGFTLSLPPLRERPGDIDALAHRFLAAFKLRHPLTSATRFTRRALEALHTHSWPGNVRELRLVVEQATMTSSSSEVTSADVAEALGKQPGRERPVSGTAPLARTGSLPEIERDMIERAFVDHGQNVSRAARSLGIPRTTLRSKLRRYGLT